MLFRICLALALGILWSPCALAGLVTLEPAHDTSIYQNDGTRSNGGGGVIFTGNNSAGSARRGLLSFDIVGNIPAGSTIDSVVLTLSVASFGGTGGAGGSDPTTYLTSLYRVSQAWGEGTAGTGSGATGSGGGFATPSNGTSATWTHAFYATQPWTSGGDFLAAASASALVSGSIDSAFTWGSTPAMVSDVQGWLDNPASNFGWILLGDESGTQTFRSFYSRESVNASLRPALTVRFTPVPEPSTLVLTMAGVVLLGLRTFRARCRTQTQCSD
jgi:hypothetical protein